MLRCFRKITAILPLFVLIVAESAVCIAPFSSTAATGHQGKPTLRGIRIERLPAPILSLDVAPHSDLAAAATSNGRVRAWHLDSGEVVHEFGFAEPDTDQRQKEEREVEPIRVRFAPDGKILGVSYLSRIYLYAVDSWGELKSLGMEGEDAMRRIPSPQLSQRPAVEKEPDDINTGTKKWAQRKMLGDGRTRITDFAFTPDGVAIVVSYCRISCYDMPEGVRWTISKGYEPVRLWDLETGRMVWERDSGPSRITERVVPSPNGKLLVEVIFQPGHWDLQFRDLASGQESYSITLSPLPHKPPDVIFTPDNRSFVTLWSAPHKMWQMAVFDTASGRVEAHLDDHAGAQRAALSASGLWLAITTWRDAAFKLWDLEKRKPLVTMKPRLGAMRVRELEIRFAADDHKIVVHDPRNGLVFTYGLSE